MENQQMLEQAIKSQCVAAKQAAQQIANSSTIQKNEVLKHFSSDLENSKQSLIDANQKDLALAHKKQLSAALLDRLELNEKRIHAMIDGVTQIIALPDPIGAISQINRRPSGLEIGRMRVPLGVIGIIYESRPNVTADASSLCLKSGNAVLLRGGSEAFHSNQLLVAMMRKSLQACALPEQAVQLIQTTDRAAIGVLLGQSESVDLIIPRGGRNLIEYVAQHAKIPVLKHLDGICHVYVDEFADESMAINIADNAKTYRYGICGAMETLLVHTDVAASFLPKIQAIYQQKGVEIRGCEKTQKVLGTAVITATEQDWKTEYLAPIIAIRCVPNLTAAIAHINQYGSAHTDAIITENYHHARQFLTQVDAASVMVNAATCFADGYEYGLGAEIGISTDKMHARGPVGLVGLTSEKFVVFGSGQTRL